MAGDPAGNVPPGDKPVRQRSTIELVQSIAQDAATLVRQEIELAKQEIAAAAISRAIGVAGLVVGGMLAFVGFLFAATAGAWALSLVLPFWASWLIVAGVFFVLAAAAMLLARWRMKKPPLVPEQTKRTVKEDVEWARAHLKP
jgi:hypothetical protein